MSAALTGSNALKFWPGVAQEVDLGAVPVPPGYEVRPGAAPKTPVPVVDDLAAVVARCAPWCTAYIVPGLRDKEQKTWGGLYSDSKVFITYNNASPPWLFEILYHEVFHAVQARMRDDLTHILNAHTTRYARLYDDETYYDHANERSARLFQHFAMALDSGLIVSPGRHPGSETITLFTHFYSGGFALDVRDLDRREAAAALKSARRAAMWSHAKSYLPNFSKEGI